MGDSRNAEGTICLRRTGDLLWSGEACLDPWHACLDPSHPSHPIIAHPILRRAIRACRGGWGRRGGANPILRRPLWKVTCFGFWKQEMLRILKPGGRLLLYNWAYEQNGRRKGSKRSHTHARATIGHWPCFVGGSAPAFVPVSQHLERGSRV
jgi:hypothetical protein